MDFFNKIKSKIRTKNFIWAIVFMAVAIIFVIFAVSNGFSSDMQWKVGIRGSRNGIPVSNWMVSCFDLFCSAVFIFISCFFLKSFIRNPEYEKMLSAVKEIGDINAIGTMLSEMPKSAFVKGADLRFNDKIFFYMKSTDVTVVAPYKIKHIGTKIERYNNSVSTFICVYYENQILKINIKEKNAMLLLEEMRKTYSFLQVSASK